jgi:hypothetical protein
LKYLSPNSQMSNQVTFEGQVPTNCDIDFKKIVRK